MKLIVGLGNPGNKYESTRHNAGFMVIDELAKKLGVELSLERKLKAELAITLRAETLILAKPATYMNLSGASVQKIAQFYKVKPEDIWVISDDLDLEFGTVRVRVGGSSGGHNGLKDIIEKVGEDFVRFRVGIKNDQTGIIPAEDFVLQKFNRDEQLKFPQIITKTLELILEGLQKGPSHTSR
jgi:PTH1 family peptidyl-tRNA hydrolase